MIIIAKYVRSSRIRKQSVKIYRTSRLFEPVIGIGRDHCRIPGPCNDGYIPGNRYIIIGKMERYVDRLGYEKSSIIPYIKLGMFRNKKRKVFGLNQCQRYDLWRSKIHNPVRKFYNVYIKNHNVYNNNNTNKVYEKGTERSRK